MSSSCLGLKEVTEDMNWTLILYTVYVFTNFEYEYTDVKGGIKTSLSEQVYF